MVRRLLSLVVPPWLLGFAGFTGGPLLFSLLFFLLQRHTLRLSIGPVVKG